MKNTKKGITLNWQESCNAILEDKFNNRSDRFFANILLNYLIDIAGNDYTKMSMADFFVSTNYPHTENRLRLIYNRLLDIGYVVEWWEDSRLLCKANLEKVMFDLKTAGY